MSKISKNIIVFYHEHCLDGFASAFVAWKKFKSRAEYISLSHTENGEDILKNKKINIKDLKGREVYFIDFCPNEIELKKVKDAAKKLVVIDHHIGKKEIINKLEGSVFKDGVSGAYLTQEYFSPKNKIPKLIKYISIGDTWTWGQEKFEREVLAYLHTEDFDFKNFSKLEKDFENKEKFLNIVNIGKVLNSSYNKMIENQIENAKLINFEGYKIYAINSISTFKSELGHILAKKSKSKFSIVYTFEGDILKISLRGDNKINLSELAKKFGGGGHFNAAGFSIKDKEKIREFIKNYLS